MPKKELFVIRPMGDPESEVRKGFDWILQKFIVPAAREAGYVPYGFEEVEGHGVASVAEIYRA